MTLLVLAASLVLAGPAARLELQQASGPRREPQRASGPRREPQRASGPRREPWLERPKLHSPRFLDHGTIELALVAGTPHLYRFELRTGLFDVASFGVTGHWLPGQARPQVWPVGALALWRARVLEFGVHYRPVLFPAVDRALTFEPRAQFVLASFTLGSGLFSAGLDFGAAHVRLAGVDTSEPTHFTRQTVFGGGFVVRLGNEWIGVSADALAALSPDPLLVFELSLDLRFDLAMVARRRDGTPQ